MARYQTVVPQTTTTTTATVTAPAAGLFTKITGSATYDVTIGDPVLYSGQSQTFYNANTQPVNLKFTTSGGGFFVGPTAPGNSTTQSIASGTVIACFSDGVNWVLALEGGGAFAGTTGTFTGLITASGGITASPATGSTVTINPTDVGAINNVNIGASTRRTGAFTTLASNGLTTFTQGGQGTSTTDATHAVLVTGGLGVSGNAYATTFIGALTGTASSATTATNATNIATTGAVSTAATYYPTFVASNGSSNQGANTATALTFNPGTGTLTATIVTASSDARLKENIKPITGALALVQQLEGVLFNRIGQTREEIGVIAQQVEAIVPQLVFTDEEGMKSVAYANTVALLIEAIKEQQVQIEELKRKVG